MPNQSIIYNHKIATVKHNVTGNLWPTAK